MKLSVVIPVCNEAENVQPLAREIQVALAAHQPFEIIFVDDGSTDATAAAACAARDGGIPEIRLLQHSRRSGQSAAVWTGVRAARADWIATLDGDGQNDPADIPVLLEALRSGDEALRLIMGTARLHGRTAGCGKSRRLSPIPYAAGSCATARRTRAAASSCSIGRRFSSCRASIICTVSCRLCSRERGRRSSRSLYATVRGRAGLRNTVCTIDCGSVSLTSSECAG
jgi:glycosyltransferase involved in cell wall biosynthesis